MEHPFKKNRENQQKFLQSLAEDQREKHAQLFRIGNASYIYHSRAENYTPTHTDFLEWLEALEEPIKSDMKKKGFEKCKSILSFTRFVMEKNDIGMDHWMQQHLSKEDYHAYSKK